MSGIGYLAVLVSVLGFGSNFCFIKSISKEVYVNIVYLQFLMCCAIFFVGIFIWAVILNFPPIYHHGEAIIGGVLWCSGNMLCPIAIKYIGMGLGLLLWGGSSMVIGWASGSYGLFGIKKNDLAEDTEGVNSEALNIMGIIVVIFGLLLLFKVKNSDDKDEDKKLLETDPLLEYENNFKTSETVSFSSNKSKQSFSLLNDETWSQSFRQFIGILSAIIAGLFFGFNFTPSQWIIDNIYNDDDENNNDHDDDGGDKNYNYIFPHFLGIFLASFFYLFLYLCIITYIDHQKKKTNALLASHIHSTNMNTFSSSPVSNSNSPIGHRMSTNTSIHNYETGRESEASYMINQLPESYNISSTGVPQTNLFYNPYYSTTPILYGQHPSFLPAIPGEMILPCIFSGFLWAIAQSFWFLANLKLGFSITFPIISAGPGFVGSLWGIFIYGEIKGRENYIYLVSSFCITIVGIVMIVCAHPA